MNYLGVFPLPDLLEESWRELARERQRQRQIQEARAVRRAGWPSRFATLAARLRRALQPDPCLLLVEGC
jgi:hypothetical protein